VPDLDDVYRKFGEVSEAAQLLETELGNLLLWARGTEQGLLTEPNSEIASELFDAINRHTLGQLIKGVNATTHN
jgi:hypothetical protein